MIGQQVLNVLADDTLRELPFKAAPVELLSRQHVSSVNIDNNGLRFETSILIHQKYSSISEIIYIVVPLIVGGHLQSIIKISRHRKCNIK